MDNNEKQKIIEAKKLLRDNGYIVKVFTQNMRNDADNCDGGECLGCSCSICIIQ